MRIEFVGYADDYTARGELELVGERLSDFLAATDELEIHELDVRALDDGRMHRLGSGVINREELCVVVATGPRGPSSLRVRTRPHPVRAESGPYAAVGYFHALPTADPRVAALRRDVIALSPAKLAYVVAGERIEEAHDALLIMRVKIDSFDPATDEDVGLARDFDMSLKVDPQAKDFTGNVRGGSET